MLLLFLKLELLETTQNYVILVSRITQLSPVLPNHQQDKHYFTLQILSYKPRNDLNIYKKSELESTFAEIINPKKSNIILV